MRTTCLRWLPGVVLLSILLPLLAHPVAAGVDRWTPIGPDGGEIWSLAADPGAPGTLYAGTEGGGVWKSLDGGASWAATPEGLPAETISSLAVSSGRVLAGHYYSMYVLTDGTAAWRQVGPFPFSAKELAVDPAHPEWFWVMSENKEEGVLLSKDGGEHWSPKLRLGDPLHSMAIAPSVPPTVYIAGNEGIFASTDAGTTWRQLDPGFPTPWNGVDLAVDPADTATVYAGTRNSGFWRTADAGEHWSFASQAALSSLLALPGALLGSSFGDVVRSEDGGDHWEAVFPGKEFRCLAADPAAPAGAWLSVRGTGLWHTSDGGRTWARQARRGLRASSIQAFAFDPFRPRILYAATPTARLQRSDDAGASWSQTLSRLVIRSLAADPRRPATLYAGTLRGGLSVSRDRGAHWEQILEEPRGIETVVVDPRRPGTIWAAGSRIWRSGDAGRTWTRLASPVDVSFNSKVRRLYLSPWHPETLYAIDFYRDGFSVPGGLWRSTDDGRTWKQIPFAGPVALAFDPTTPDLLYAAGDLGDIQKSRDGGKTWETVASSIAGDYHLTALLMDRLDPSVLYAGTEGKGVWRSLDQGVTWQPFSTGLIAPLITCLEADPRNPRRIVACTQGGGLLEIQISPGS